MDKLTIEFDYEDEALWSNPKIKFVFLLRVLTEMRQIGMIHNLKVSTECILSDDAENTNEKNEI